MDQRGRQDSEGHEGERRHQRAEREPAQPADAVAARAPAAEPRADAHEGSSDEGEPPGQARRCDAPWKQDREPQAPGDQAREEQGSPDDLARSGQGTRPPKMPLMPATRPFRRSSAEALAPMRAPPASEANGVKFDTTRVPPRGRQNRLHAARLARARTTRGIAGCTSSSIQNSSHNRSIAARWRRRVRGCTGSTPPPPYCLSLTLGRFWDGIHQMCRAGETRETGDAWYRPPVRSSSRTLSPAP